MEWIHRPRNWKKDQSITPKYIVMNYLIYAKNMQINRHLVCKIEQNIIINTYYISYFVIVYNVFLKT